MEKGSCTTMGKGMHVMSWGKGCMYYHGKRDACTVMEKEIDHE